MLGVSIQHHLERDDLRSEHMPRTLSVLLSIPSKRYHQLMEIRNNRPNDVRRRDTFPQYIEHQVPTPNRIHLYLEGIDKLRVLFIRQIQPLLVLQLAIVRLCPKRSLLLVLIPKVPPDENQVHETGSPANNDGDLGGRVTWSILGTKRLGS